MALMMAAFCVPACKSSKTANQSEPPKTTEAKPQKVLIQNSDTTPSAADGLFFVVVINATQKMWAAKEPDKAKGISLESTNGLTVVAEDVDNSPESKKEKEKTDKPQSNPKDFNFVVKHTVDYVEQKKKSLNDPIRLSVKETWTVEKVSDPTVKTTKTVEYILDADSNLDTIDKVTEEQINKVVKPARAPILIELREFIDSNRKM